MTTDAPRREADTMAIEFSMLAKEATHGTDAYNRYVAWNRFATWCHNNRAAIQAALTPPATAGDARKAAEEIIDEICSAVGKHLGYAMTLDRSRVYHSAEEIILRHFPPSAEAKPGLTEAMRIVNEQADNDDIWFVAQTVTEAYLQQELRRLHAAIEGTAPEQIDAAAITRSTTGGQKS